MASWASPPLASTPSSAQLPRWVTQRTNETASELIDEPPALMFDEIAGYPQGFRVLSLPAGSDRCWTGSRQPCHSRTLAAWARCPAR